ncbi:acetylglutamate kinase [Roseospirillum parvum]|nr:acetylglutamate kinase [Roseospirillum parvum]
MLQKDLAAERAVWMEKARTLSEALPYMRRFAGQTIVVKYGGHAMGDPELARLFARDIVLLKQVGIHPVVVHGGGPQIKAMLDRLKIQSEFVHGLRVTDRETVDIVEMVLAGSINKQIVQNINQAGGFAVGLSGKDGNLIRAERLSRTVKDPDSAIEKALDLGFVGAPRAITSHILESFRDSDIIPVIAPIGFDAEGHTYNINADTAAGAVAGALKATRLLMLTDVAGVLDQEGNLVTDLTTEDARALIADGTISGGMIPKVETCLAAIREGVKAAVILDGRVQHAVLLEIFTPGGAGTLMKSAAGA